MAQATTDPDLDRCFRSLLESLPRQAVLTLSPDGRIERWNAAAERLFGWAEAEAVGQPGDILFTPEDRAAGVPQHEISMATRDGYAFDDRWHLRKDGSRIHVTGSMNALRSLDGRLRGLVKLVREDTDRIAALERLELAQTAGGIGSFEWLVRENRLIWSRELEAMYGMPPGTFSGRYEDWRPLVHPDDLPRVEAGMQEAIARRERYETEFRIRRGDGEERWMIGRGLCHFDPASAPVRVVGVTIDITETKRATERAERGRRTLQALLAQAPIGIILVGGPPDNRIEHASDFACRLVGRDCAALTGQRIGEHLDAWGLRAADGGAITDPRTLPLARALSAGETIENEELVIERGDGVRVPVLVNAGPIRDPAGGIVGAVLAFSDIGDRRDVEERLRTANHELEQFAYVASHDMQEPLRMIASYLGLLQRKYSAHLDGRANEYIGFAVDGAERMQKLIRQLLDYARLERAPTQMVDIDSGRALDDALRVLAERIAESGATVTHADLPRLRADPDLLVRLFQNLVGNALKYSAKARAPQVRVTAERGDHGWTFAVHDNGIGIPPEDRERVFAVFQRLHTRDEYPGTGLGLAICKRIVDRHGGRIWVESNPGEGSTFRFTIPDPKA